jgi:transketolase
MTYAICGDGDLMEGVAAEAASMAGHLKLGKLVVLYDSNDISLDGDLHVSFSENVEQRFNSYGWQVLHVADGNDVTAIAAALQAAQQDTARPTLIEVKTVIGFGSPNKAGKGGHVGPHGSPLGKDETVLTKQVYGWPTDQAFYIPEEVKAHFAAVQATGAAAEQAWNEQLAAYRAAEPQLAAQLEQAIAGQLPIGWDADLPTYEPGSAKVSTRVASGAAINALAPRVPALFGGSADLASSNNTTIKGADIFSASQYGGRNIWFGVREFAMAAAVNGMGLHGALKPFGATFFVFSDYLRPAVRLAALMQLPVTFVFTHDSIAVGEDGPTHEPIEHLAAMRVIPGLTVIRPADANETIAAWRYAITNSGGPVALVLTRQNLAVLQGTGDVAQLERGGYVVAGAELAQPQAQLLATGSEVSLAIEAQQALAAEGIAVRVVNMPSLELFARQPQAYRDAVILPNVKARLAIEMGHPFGWERYVGDGGSILGIDHFGASAPGERIMKEFGFSVENVVARVKALL